MDKKFKSFVIIALIILTIIASAAVFLVLTTRPVAQVDGSAEVSAKVSQKDLVVLPMESALNANLKIGEDGAPHITRLAIGIQVDAKHKDYKDFAATLENNQIVIRDGIIRIVRNKTYAEMMAETAQDDVATQITTVINDLLSTDIVQDIYFEDFFVQ